jgi:hypothetical protein
MNKDPLSTNMGSTFYKRLEEEDLVKKRQMTKPTQS